MRVSFLTKAPRPAGVGLLLLGAVLALAPAAQPAPCGQRPSRGTPGAEGGSGTVAAERAGDKGRADPGAEGAAATDTAQTYDDEVFSSNKAIRVPLRQIGPKFSTKVRELLGSHSIDRRLPTRLFIADLKTYEYLLNHLPLASKLSDLLGYGHYRLVQEADGRLHGTDFKGVTGDVWLVYSDPNKRIYYGEGSYNAWYMPKISAKLLMAVEYRVVSEKRAAGDAGGRAGGATPGMRVGSPESGRSGPPPPIATRVDVYLQTNKLIGYIMQLLGQVADKKLTELVSSARLTSQDLSRDPEAVFAKMNASGEFTTKELEDLRSTLVDPRKD